jgi:hypothetical protein
MTKDKIQQWADAEILKIQAVADLRLKQTTEEHAETMRKELMSIDDRFRERRILLENKRRKYVNRPIPTVETLDEADSDVLYKEVNAMWMKMSSSHRPNKL